MTTDRLKLHYETKYASARDEATTLLTIPMRMPMPKDRYEAACSFLPDFVPPQASILELGAGDGRVAHSLRQGGVAFGTYTLGDISEARLEGLRKSLHGDQFRFIYADADDITKDVDGAFDGIVMIALIEHLVDPMRSMQAIRQMLKPGGFVYVDTPNIAKWTRRAKLALGRFPSTASVNEGLTTYSGEPSDLYDEGHLHYFTYRSLALMLTKRCGFTSVREFGYYLDDRPFGRHFGTALARRWPSLFSELSCVAYA